MLTTLVYIAIAILILMFMVTVHELGHYLAGKMLGFKINEFSVGFGRALFKRTNKRTGEVFALRLIPLGGYCAFEGDDAAAGEGGARAEAKERAAAGEKAIGFNEQAPWKRLIVLFAGAFFNFISAILFSVILLMVVGYQQTVTIKEVRTGADNPNTAIYAESGITAGDKIVAINGERLALLNHYNMVYKNHYKNGDKISMTFLHDGKEIVVEGLTVYPENADKTFFGPGLLLSHASYVPMSLLDALGKCIGFCFEIAWMILVALWGIVTLKVSLNDIGGPVATVSVMAQSMKIDIANILFLVPLISVNLALFNLLPIPALDGARMVFVGIEWARGKPVDPNLEARIHMIGLIVLFSFVILADFNYLLSFKYFTLGHLRL